MAMRGMLTAVLRAGRVTHRGGLLYLFLAGQAPGRPALRDLLLQDCRCGRGIPRRALRTQPPAQARHLRTQNPQNLLNRLNLVPRDCRAHGHRDPHHPRPKE